MIQYKEYNDGTALINGVEFERGSQLYDAVLRVCVCLEGQFGSVVDEDFVGDMKEALEAMHVNKKKSYENLVKHLYQSFCSTGFISNVEFKVPGCDLYLKELNARIKYLRSRHGIVI